MDVTLCDVNGSKMAEQTVLLDARLDDVEEDETGENIANNYDYIAPEIARTPEKYSTKLRFVIITIVGLMQLNFQRC